MGVHADLVVGGVGSSNGNSLHEWIEDGVLHGEVDVGLHVHLEDDGSLVDNGSIGNDEAEGGHGVLKVSEDNTVLGGHLDWGSLSVGGEGKIKRDVGVLSVVLGNLWEDLEELGGDICRSERVWEEAWSSNIDERVDGVLVEPELLSVSVCDVWEVVMLLQLEVVAAVAVLWLVEETVEVELDEMLVLLDHWSGSHGEVQWLVLAEH